MYKAINRHVVILSSLVVLGGCGAADGDFENDIDSPAEAHLDPGFGGIGGQGGFGGSFEEDDFEEEDAFEDEAVEEEEFEEEDFEEGEVVEGEEEPEGEVVEEDVEADNFEGEVEEDEIEEDDSYERRGIQVCEEFEAMFRSSSEARWTCSPECGPEELRDEREGCAPATDAPLGYILSGADSDRALARGVDKCPSGSPFTIESGSGGLTAPQPFDPPQVPGRSSREPIEQLEFCFKDCPAGWEEFGDECWRSFCPEGWSSVASLFEGSGDRCARVYTKEYERPLDAECPDSWIYKGNHCYEPCDDGYEADGDRCVLSD